MEAGKQGTYGIVFLYLWIKKVYLMVYKKYPYGYFF